MLRSFIAFLFLLSTIVLLLLPAVLVIVGFACGGTFIEKSIIVGLGLLLSRLFRPISVLLRNDNLKF